MCLCDSHDRRASSDVVKTKTEDFCTKQFWQTHNNNNTISTSQDYHNDMYDNLAIQQMCVNAYTCKVGGWPGEISSLALQLFDDSSKYRSTSILAYWEATIRMLSPFWQCRLKSLGPYSERQFTPSLIDICLCPSFSLHMLPPLLLFLFHHSPPPSFLPATLSWSP